MKLLPSLILVVCAAAYSWGCCTPPQWEGIQSNEVGYSTFFKKGLVRELSCVAYDATNKRSAVFTAYRNNGYENKFQIIKRYHDDEDSQEKCGCKGKMYIVDLKKNKCYTKHLHREFEPLCTPAKAKSTEFYLGLKGVFKVRGFEIKKDFRKGHVMADLSVYELGKDNLCVPIGLQMVGKMRGVDFMESVGFVNLTPGIKNATVFDVPKACDKYVDVSEMEDMPERDHYIMAL